ncbi:DNA alkylation repair protein [Saccharicrinis sp. FJH62]|uniref:DNA alkylation repair protein n=1 Tax=Saccharicrinis sp. FJH62 TaxID=3344657 RepID=UPI0035D52B46
MDFTFINDTTEKDLKLVLNQINLHKNGTVSQSMKDAGLNYRVNFGVSVVDLRKIAKQYAYNNTLAKLLWEKGWRESYILATLIADPETIDIETLTKWMNEILTTELSEQLGNNLIASLPYSSILKDLLNSGNNLMRIAAYKALSKQFLMKNFDNKDVFVKSLEFNLYDSALFRRELAVSLGQASAFFIRYHNNLINYLLEKISYFQVKSNDFELTHQIVITEIDFFCEKDNSE